MKPYLSVIIPSYNEMKNIGRGVVQSVIEYLKTTEYEWEVIFTDDGSTDGTVEFLESFIDKQPGKIASRLKVLKNPHAGKGPTVQSGMLAAAGEWRLFTDFDQSTPLKEVELLLHFTSTHQVIIGSREIAGAHRTKEPLYRHVMGKGFNIFTQLLAIPGIMDTQCGFKLFSATATEAIFSKLYVYGRKETRKDAFTGAFDVEALFLARKYGFQIKEVPIFWQHNETDRVSPVKDSSRMIRDILHVRLAEILGKYKR